MKIHIEALLFVYDCLSQKRSFIEQKGTYGYLETVHLFLNRYAIFFCCLKD